MTYNIITI